MLYILFSLFTAMLFGLGAVAVYGYDGLLANPWIDTVFWWLIGTGVALAALDVRVDLRCLVCQRTGGAPNGLCHGVSC